MDIYLLTRNKGKLMAAQSAFEGASVTLLPVERDYPEIQAETSMEIARYTAVQAAKELGAPAIREDHSFFINAFGIPGPYMNFFEKRISAQKLLEMLAHEKDRTGYFEVATVYAKPDGTTNEFTFKVSVSLLSNRKTAFLLGMLSKLKGRDCRADGYRRGEIDQ